MSSQKPTDVESHSTTSIASVESKHWLSPKARRTWVNIWVGIGTFLGLAVMGGIIYMSIAKQKGQTAVAAAKKLGEEML